MKRVKTILLIIGLLISILFFFSSTPSGLNIQGKNAIIIFVLALTLWVSNIIPLAATSLLAMALLPILDVMPASRAFSFFGNEAVFFLLGIFILAAVTIRIGLSKRITLYFLKRFDKSPGHLLFGIFLTTTVCALWMPAHAVAAMTFPVILEIATALNLKKRKSNFGKALFLSMAWGAIIGGIGTFLGGARAPLAVGLLNTTYGTTISFSRWFLVTFPVVIIMFIVGNLIISWKFKPEISNVKIARYFLQNEINRIGKTTLVEIKLLVLLLLTIFFWIFFGQKIGLATISIVSAVLVFILRITRWDEIQDYINWGIIIMYGGAIALGKALADTGCLKWCIDNFLVSKELSVGMIILAIPVVSIFLTEGISNSAVVAILIPLGFSMIDYLDISPVAIVFLITVPAGLPFCLPMGTPPNAIAYSSGYYSIKDSVKAGIFLNIIAIFVLWLVMYFYWPIVGINVF